jgi:hypothetical protein
MWPAGDRIARKKAGQKRIALLGESTARGWSIALEPAVVLQDLLSQQGNAVDVVNIAKVKLDLDELADLIPKVHHLEADHVIVWAGSNWDEFLEDPIGPLLDGFEKDGISGLREGRRRIVLEQLEARILAPLGKMVASGVGVTCIVPEFNLLDWSAAATQFTPVLEREDGKKWLALKRKTEAALQKGDVETAHASAKEMLALDQGDHPYTLRTLGECSLLKKQPAEARRWFEAARDVPLTEPEPRCPSYAQNYLRKRSPELGIKVLDLAEVLHSSSDGIPDRRLFVDYVHLNLRGIFTTMKAVAGLVSEAMHLHWDSTAEIMISKDKVPSDQSLAVSSVLAAIHNGNWGCTRKELLDHHLKQALELDRGSASLILSFFSTRMHSSVPDWMSSNYEPFREPTRDLLCGQFTARPAIVPLLEAIRRVLSETQDASVGAEVERLWNHVWDVNTLGDVHLISPERVARSWKEAASVNDMGWFEAFRDTEKFPFVCNKPKELELRGAYRTHGDEPVTLLLNGKQLARLEAARSWKSFSFKIDASQLRTGENDVTFVWEYGDEDVARSRRAALDLLEVGDRPNYYHSFGGLQGLRVSVPGANKSLVRS